MASLQTQKGFSTKDGESAPVAKCLLPKVIHKILQQQKTMQILENPKPPFHHKKLPEKKIIGYDPGGNDRHGVAIVSVSRRENLWQPLSVDLHTLSTADEVIELLSKEAPDGTLLAAGIDTLTAWTGSRSGWRPADDRLRKRYCEVRASVDNPNHINGSMCLNGAFILHALSQRNDKNMEVTEAHPKVLYYALNKQRHPWSKDRDPSERADAARWLIQAMALEMRQDWMKSLMGSDHEFDALLGALAAWKGLNREWTTDLHDDSITLHPFGRTHYWWPEKIPDSL